ncbi:MAG: hypothetical protein IKB70_00430 [Bacilli bacterium]|nr:hypothetical protein [Bacilli bacterium]
MERDSFVFYASFLEAINELPNESQLKVYKAITNFALKGIEPTDLEGIEKGIFALIKPQILANYKRYLDGCNGGRPKKEKPMVIEKENHRLSKRKTNGYENKKPNENVNDNDNVNENDNNKRENIKEKSLVVAEATTPTPQAEVFEFFAKIYKQETNIDYLGKKVDCINLAKLIKKYGKAMVIQKIRWLLIGCRNSVFFFSKDMTDFNISTLTTHWDRILPKLTDEQKREQEKKRKEEEQKKRVLAELEKQGIVLEGGNNVRLQ